MLYQGSYQYELFICQRRFIIEKHKTIVMKKLVLMLVVAIAAISNASAMNLKEAFNALSNIQNVNVVTPDYNLPIDADIVQNGQLAAGYNLNKEQIAEAGTAAFTILNQVPLTSMVNGGNNGEVATFIYATPNDSGSNDVLVVAMSGYKGSVVFLYTTANDDDVAAIKAAPLKIEGNFLSLEAQLPNDNQFNIILSKAR